MIITVLMLFCCAAAGAEGGLSLSTDELAVGDRLLIEASDSAPRRSFTLYRGDEQVNTGAMTEAKHAAMNPQEPGVYRLVVQPEGQDPVSAGFTVYGAMEVSLSLSMKTMQVGEVLDVTALTEGGAPEKTFEFSVWNGTERIARDTNTDGHFEYIPLYECTLTVSVNVADSIGGKVSAVAEPVTVAGMAGLTVTGDMSPMLVQGGIRGWTVDAPGPWNARTEQQWVKLINACGDSGDSLIFAVSASESGPRTAVITVSSMGLTRKVALQQSDQSEEEAEVFLFDTVAGWVKADGKSALSWQPENAEAAEMAVRIEASGGWHAETDADYLHLEQEGDQLYIRIDKNDTQEYRNESIHVRSGDASAVIGVSQPGKRQGASVREVILDGDRGRAYQDQIGIMVLTDPTAESVSLRIDQQASVTYGTEYAKETEEGLQWHFDVPLTGAGGQSWLFSADNAYGSGEKALATISVEGEPAGFATPPAGTENLSQINVIVTQNTEKIETLDHDGRVTATYTTSNARVDRVISEDTDRYAEWTLPVSDIQKAASLRIGDVVQPVSWHRIMGAAASTELSDAGFRPYSQMDGTWRYKSYRKSNLEQSGCAIFALSHALQLMGHEEPASKPEQLAVTYAFCLVDGGTLNSTLIGNAGKEFGYKTRYKLYTGKQEIMKKFSQGAMFSFAIVSGHIALIDRLSDDGKMCHIIDSAPTATFERIKGETPYLYNEKSGQYVPLSSPAEIPGLLYYVDTEGFDGAEYWLPLDYVAERGVRLIQPGK